MSNTETVETVLGEVCVSKHTVNLLNDTLREICVDVIGSMTEEEISEKLAYLTSISHKNWSQTDLAFVTVALEMQNADRQTA